MKIPTFYTAGFSKSQKFWLQNYQKLQEITEHTEAELNLPYLSDLPKTNQQQIQPQNGTLPNNIY